MDRWIDYEALDYETLRPAPSIHNSGSLETWVHDHHTIPYRTRSNRPQAHIYIYFRYAKSFGTYSTLIPT